MKKVCILMICVACAISFPFRSFAEYRIYHLDVPIQFETLLEEAQTLYAQKTGKSLELVRQLEYTWSASPKYILIPSADHIWSSDDASWRISISTEDENGYVRWLDYYHSMLELSDEDATYFSYNEYKKSTFPYKESFEAEYNRLYNGVDAAVQSLEAEKGPYFLWSYEEKARYFDQWGIYPHWRERYVLGDIHFEHWLWPEETDIPYEEMMKMARDSVKSEFSLSDEMMHEFYEDVRFCSQWNDEPRWEVRFWLNVDCGGKIFWESCCIVCISRDGRLECCYID